MMFSSCIDGCSIKLVHVFSHFWCKESRCKYVSLHHERPEMFHNSLLKSCIKDQGLTDPMISISESCLENIEKILSVKGKEKIEEEVYKPLEQSSPRRIRVQERIILFENKQKEIELETGEVVPKDLPSITKQVQRKSEGNEKLNEKLKMKADELEKLFAEHKLHVHRKHIADSMSALILTQNMVFETPDQVPVLAPVLVPARVDSRGKLYNSYMKKREVRLRVLWDSNRSTMNSMHDKLSKLSWYIESHDSVSITRNRSDRLRLFMKREQIKDDDDTSEFSVRKSFVNGVSGTAQGKKALPVKNLSTSNRTKSSTNLASSVAGRQKVRYDKVREQSFPRFYDFQKENAKPYFQQRSRTMVSRSSKLL